jgi:hypothetical protein
LSSIVPSLISVIELSMFTVSLSNDAIAFS